LSEVSQQEEVSESIEEKVSKFSCDSCAIEFPNKRALAGHNVGKHKQHQKCSLCSQVFESRGKLGHHKIEIHGYSMEQLGWRRGGWNKGKSQYEAFKALNPHHGSPDFMRILNTDPSTLEKKQLSHKFHEQVVIRKQEELRSKGYRTFITSNWGAHQSRLPDIIAISPDNKVIAVEMESIRRWKSRIENFAEKYRRLLLQDGFFDDVIVESFLGIDWRKSGRPVDSQTSGSPQDSNKQKLESKTN
jgi:hypothetical protein